MASSTKFDSDRGVSKSKKRLFEDDGSAPDALKKEHASILNDCKFVPANTQKVEPADDTFGINRNYATKYNEWRKKEEQQRMKSKYGEELHADDDSDTSSDEESDEADDELAPAEDINFLRALSLVKKKDPRVYSKTFRIFPTVAQPEPNSAGPGPDDAALPASKRTKNFTDRPMTLADYEVKIAVEKGGVLDDEVDTEPLHEFDNEDVMRKKFSYDEEQKLTKKAFLDVLDSENGTNAGGIDDDNLLAKRTKTAEEKREEEQSYLLWLKGKRSDLGGDDPTAKDAEKDLQFLHDYWNDPKLDVSEQFLRDYILNKRYLEPEEGAATSQQTLPAPRVFRTMPDVPEIEPEIETDAKEFEREEEFERKFNFRFEEPDPEFIKLYPRTIGDSVRAGAANSTSTRKTQRESARERQQRQLQQRREEIRQYKSVIKQEVQEKIEKLKQIAGNDALDLTFEELEADFDPAEYDKKMQNLFGSEYYSSAGGDQEQNDEKPVFSDESDLEEDWDTYSLQRDAGENAASSKAGNSQTIAGGQSTNLLDKSEKSDDIQSRKVKKPKRQSKFAHALKQTNRPAYDPNSGKTFEEYFNDYYKLDCEDVIAGGQIPTRFHYRKTQPNNFGLTAEEILLAPENELNAWVSLKRVVAQRDDYEEERDDRLFKQMAESTFKKKKKLPSLFKNSTDKVDADDDRAVNHDDDATVTEQSENVAEATDAVDETETPEQPASSSSPTTEAKENGVEEENALLLADAGKNGRRKRRRRQKQPFSDSEPQRVTPAEEDREEASKNVENDAKAANTDVSQAVAGKRRRRNRKKTQNGPTTQSAKIDDGEPKHIKQYRVHHHGVVKKSAQHQNHSRPLPENVKQHPVFQLSDERLRAYGLNPKKIRNRVQYGAE